MAILEGFQDSATISDTEYFLAADSTTQGAGQSTDVVVQLFLEVNNLAAGDLFRVRAYESVSSGGTARVIWEDMIVGPAGTPLYVTPTLVVMHKWDFSVTRISGSNRSIAWSIRTVA